MKQKQISKYIERQNRQIKERKQKQKLSQIWYHMQLYKISQYRV